MHSYLANPPKILTLSLLFNNRVLQIGSDTRHSYLRILGVRFDRRLTFKHHVQYLCQKTNLRLQQLSRVSNSIYGITQSDLRTMYIAYVRSVLEYAAPVWYPCLSRSNLEKIQRIQNRALRIVLGIPRSTRIDALHFEASIPPIKIRFDIATAYIC